MIISEQEISDAKSKIVDVISARVDLKKVGSEHVALCPFHDEKTPSLTVTPDVEKFYCFGCGAAGDAIEFVQRFENISFVEAVNRINGNSQPGQRSVTPKPQNKLTKEKAEWEPITPLPANAGEPPNTFSKKMGEKWVKLSCSMRWPYLDAADGLLGYVCRFELPGGGKDVIPQTFCVNTKTGETSWKWMSFSKPRPIYGLDLLAQNPGAQVVVAEGEKAADAGRKRYLSAGVPESKLVVISWPGGGKGVKQVDWRPLKGRRVGLWPDADQKKYPEMHRLHGELMRVEEQPGMSCMLDIADRIQGLAESIKIIMPPAGVPDGWDLADEFPPSFDILQHSKTAITVEEFKAKYLEQEQMMPPTPTGPTENEQNPKPKPDGYFTLLGYNHDAYFIFQHERKQLSVLTKGDLSETGLMTMAPLGWWEINFPGDKGIDRKAAINWFIRHSHMRGVYDASRVRGRGAWIDEGRVVFHCGTELYVDSTKTDVTAIKSRYVYELDKRLATPGDHALSDADGKKILDVAQMFRFTKEASSALLAGWVALAPLCGAIKWRPHIWITGGAGSGKSTLVNGFVHALLGGIDVYAQGNSTEAGIRQTLRCDALPVLFDESESNEERDRMRIQGVLSMVRQASTESAAKTYKGTASGDSIHFHIRSMFCLSSIQVGIKLQADFERLTILALKSKAEERTDEEKEKNADEWQKLKDTLYIFEKDETLPSRLLRRSLDLLPVTLKNIDIFSEAGARKFGSQREGDQYGTLLAGAWSLVSDRLATLDEATAWIDLYDWTEYLENSDTEESVKALGSLLEAQIKIKNGATNIYELIMCASGNHIDSLEMLPGEAGSILQRHGIKVKDDKILLSNVSRQLRDLVEGTPYGADLRGQLLRIKGADRYDNRSVWFNGTKSKCIALPLASIIDKKSIMENNSEF